LSRNAYQFSFAEPWVDKNNTSVRFSIYDQFQFRFNRGFSNNFTDGLNSNQYFETRRGGSLSISRPLTADRFTRGFATVRSERTDANNLASNYQQLTDLEIAQFRGALIQNGNVNAITLGMTANPVDNVLDPSRGYYFQPSIEVGRSQFDFRKPFLNPAYVDATTTPNIDRVLLESRSQSGAFAKYSVDYRRYFSLDGKPRVNLGEGKKVFATRLLYGTAIGNISFAEQYFMGGVDNLRGYQNERFWGNNQFLLSNELRLPLDKQANTVGVFFVDIGDAWGAADVNRENIAGFEQHRSFKPSVGLGIGLRVRTPLGPIRLDYGFGRGGRGVSHFSIGQAF
jgi:outer membrane protein assembly factor BamA